METKRLDGAQSGNRVLDIVTLSLVHAIQVIFIILI